MSYEARIFTSGMTLSFDVNTSNFSAKSRVCYKNSHPVNIDIHLTSARAQVNTCLVNLVAPLVDQIGWDNDKSCT